MDLKKLEHTAIDYAAYRIKDSLLTLISDITEPEDSNELFAPSSPQLKSICQEILDIYPLLEDMIDLELDERTELLNRLHGLSKRIVDYAVRVNAYTCCCNQLGDYLTDIYRRNDIKKTSDEVELNNSLIASKIHDFAHKQPDSTDGSFELAKLMQALPLRMTRDKYNDYVTTAIKKLLSIIPYELYTSTVARLKNLFYSPVSDEMKSDFPLMYERISEIYKLDASELGNDTIEEYLAALDDNIETLSNEYAELCVYFTDVNYLSIIVDYCVDSDFLFDDDIMLKDLFYAVNDYLRNKDDSLKNDIYERTIAEIESRFEATKPKLDGFKKAISELKDEDMSESLQLFCSVCKSVDEYYYTELDHAIMLYDEPKEAEELAEDMLEYINAVTADMPRERQKQLKQRFLSKLPTSYDPEQLSEYARYALDGVRSKESAILSYMLIFDIIESEDDDEHSESCDCGHEHHHHDSCDCGHEHHHHDSCDCGHEHHHHDSCDCGHEHHHH